MSVLKGKERRAYLVKMRQRFEAAIRRELHKDGCPVSLSEGFGEALAAVEKIGGDDAEKLRQRAQICRDEYCRDDGGLYSRIKEKVSGDKIMLTRDQITEWPDLRDRLDRAQEIITGAVEDGRKLTPEEAGRVSDAINAARAALGEGETE